MSLNALTIEVPASADPTFVADLLFELGALSVTSTPLNPLTSAESFLIGSTTPTTPITTPLPWPDVLITAHFPFTYQTEALIMTLAADYNLPLPCMRLSSIDTKTPGHWIRLAQDCLQPVILSRVAITFPWHPPTPARLNVVLQPGVAFGNGEHATTRLCAVWLERVVTPKARVLDYGTGTGVLAIMAAALEDGVSAVGVDIDEDAVRVARGNAELNGVAGRVRFCKTGEGAGEGVFDVVVANILADVLKKLADELVGRMAKGGRIALSGVLASQAADVREWYAGKGVVMEDAEVDGEWALLVGRKNGR